MKTESAKKVADLDKVVKLCGALGPNYTPGNEALSPTALASLLVVANEKLKAVNSAQVAAAMLVKERRLLFSGIPSLAAKIVRRVMSSQSSVAEQMQAREIKRKYFASGKLKAEQASSPEGAEPSTKFTRTIHRDFAGQLSGLEQLIHLVSTLSGYKSIEPMLRLEGLHQTFAELQAVHVATINAQMVLAQARKARNEVVYTPNGVSATIQAFKNYLRSKYGANDPTLKQL